MDYDLAVIGGGPGGYTAAIRAKQLGLTVALIEKDGVGGTCLQRGCIPKEILHHFSHLYLEGEEALKLGVFEGKPRMINAQNLRRFAQESVNKITRSLGATITNSGVHLIRGTATFVTPTRLRVDEKEEIEVGSVIVATGARPKVLPVFAKNNDPRILTSTEAFLPTAQPPTHILIVGGGPIGCEFASFYRACGADVTIIEKEPRLLPFQDHDVAQELERIFTRVYGMQMRTGRVVTECATDEDALRLALDNGDVLEGSHVLLAVGTDPVTEGLGLDALGVELRRGFIAADPVNGYRTNIENIFAIGDVIALSDSGPHPQLAHVAVAEGKIAAATIAGHDPREYLIDYDNIPSAIFTIPEISSVGFTEAQARELSCREPNHRIGSYTFPYRYSGLAAALGKTEGFKKVVLHNEYAEVLGMHIIGYRAVEEIGIPSYLRHTEGDPQEAARLILPHPTFNELTTELFELIDGMAIHVPRFPKE